MMRKQLLVSVGALCVASVSLIGQNKYNNLMANQLFGAVKEVNTIRKSYMENSDEYPGFVDSKWSTTYDSYGYITNSEEYTYQWNATYTQCSCETPPRTDYDPNLYGSYKFNVNTTGNEFQFLGECNKYLGASKALIVGEADTFIIYGFDDNGRLLTLKNFADLLLDLSMSCCFGQTFSYKGAEKLPYEAEYDFGWDFGSEGCDYVTYNLSISYVKTDSKGNWLHRKLYDMEDNKLLVEETRTITYHSVTPPTSSQSAPQHKNAL